MNLDKVGPGSTWPNRVEVIIEIPSHSDPIKYEIDKDTGAMFVDRFLTTPMHYPCNYGYIPKTLSKDGDPVDVLLVTPYPLISGSVVLSRPIGVLKMTDQAGDDPKILAVPVSELTSIYDHIKTVSDMPIDLLNRIEYFFEHYKDLDEGKWARVDRWYGLASARKEITEGICAYNDVD
jgi:inorganic pyrophosphatase